MEKITVDSTPDVVKPVFAVALPGVGNVGVIALGLLLKFSDSKRFGNYYSKNFPDYVVIEDNGLCHLPRFDLYASKSVNPNIVMMISNTPIISEESKSHYDVLDRIVEFALEIDSSLLVAVDALAVVNGKPDTIHVTGTTSELVTDFEKLGARQYEAEKLPGSVGLLLGLSEYHGLRGIGVIGSTTSFVPDNNSGNRMYEFLLRALHLRKIDVHA